VDLETQLARDRDQPIDELRLRDQRLRQELPALPATLDSRKFVFKKWLASRRQSSLFWPGKRLRDYERIILVLLLLSSSLAGWGTMRVMLAYDGQQPINVIPVIGIFIVLPVVLLLLLPVKGVLVQWGQNRGSWEVLWSDRFWHWLVRRLSVAGHQAAQPLSQEAWWQAMRRVSALYQPIIRQWVWQRFQILGFSFYAVGWLTLLYLGVFYDLRFAWGTTLHLPAEDFATVIRGLGYPIRWLLPDWVPDASIIALTEYDRFQNQFLGGADQDSWDILAASRLWWRYLLACVALYGVLPRIGLWLMATFRLRAKFSGLAFDDHACQSLWYRLTEVSPSWAAGPGTSPTAAPGSEGSSESPRPAVGSSEFLEPDSWCWVVRWLDVPIEDDQIREFLSQRYSLTVAGVSDAVGTAADQSRLLAQLKEAPVGQRPVLLFLHDPWELPGEALETLIAKLRTVGDGRIMILLAPLVLDSGYPTWPGGQDLVLWRKIVNSWHDPYVGLLADLGGVT
jgi:hypothetical protein